MIFITPLKKQVVNSIIKLSVATVITAMIVVISSLHKIAEKMLLPRDPIF